MDQTLCRYSDSARQRVQLQESGVIQDENLAAVGQRSGRLAPRRQVQTRRFYYGGSGPRGRSSIVSSGMQMFRAAARVKAQIWSHLP